VFLEELGLSSEGKCPMRFKRIFTAILLMASCVVSANAQLTVSLDKVVSVVSLIDYAPYVFVDGSKAVEGVSSTQKNTDLVKGYSWEVFQESFYAMGYSIKYTIVPWSRAIKILEFGHAELLFPMSKSDERLKKYNYSREPVNTVDYVIYSHKNASLKWKGFNSLSEKIIGEKRGFNYGKNWNALSDVIKYQIGNISNGFQMLQKGHINGFIGYKDSWDYVLKEEGLEGEFIKTPIIGSSSEYVVSMKDRGQHSDLLEVYSQGKRKIIENGIVDKLKAKWFVVNQAK
jgi:polar amino acid transport system substrate-binding protein